VRSAAVVYSMNNKLLDEQMDYVPVPDGQERLATQAERDDVNERIDGLQPTPVKTSDQQ
jgi:hypothetical protein